ncbi:MAG: L-threonylcarbamoyladenylate synthase [Caldisericota bacterium]|nr:L-threonylcarbamoyladenylate synthase [Caldisericota bacterium]
MKEFELARKALLEHKIIAFPTDTVIGIGVNGLDQLAVEKLFALKNRPFEKPLSLLTYSSTEILKYARLIPSYAYSLLKTYFPGPMTAVFYSDEVLYTTPFGKGTSVGVRIPNFPILLDFLAYIKMPLLATSANVSNRPALLTKEDVVHIFGDAVYPILFEYNVTSSNVSSTVIDCRGKASVVLRKGEIDI